MVEVTTLDGIALVLFFYISYHYLSRQSSAQFNSTAQSAQSAQSVQSAQRPLKSIMSAPRDDLAPPKDDPYTPEQLKAYDGADPDKPIYVAIKGMLIACSLNAVLTDSPNQEPFLTLRTRQTFTVQGSRITSSRERMHLGV